MIKSLSPYYYETPWISPLTGATASKYTINLYIWSGDKNTIPTEPQYSLTKNNVSTNIGTDKVDVSKLCNDFIQFVPTLSTGLVNSPNQRWVHKEIIYKTTDPADDDVKQLPVTELLLKGYSYGFDGENGQPPTDLVFTSSREFKVSRNTIWSIPMQMDNAGFIFVKSYPDNQINIAYDTSIIDLTQSSSVVRVLNTYVPNATSDKYILIEYNGQEIFAEITDEYRYEPIDIYFLNKEGEQQSLTFFKERRDSMSVTKEMYESDLAQPNTGAHQFVDLNVQARSSFTASSGFVDEQLNEEFKQLALSSRVYENRDGTLIPINVATANVEYKTRVNDRLVNYVFDFKYSYNEINNI